MLQHKLSPTDLKTQLFVLAGAEQKAPVTAPAEIVTQSFEFGSNDSRVNPLGQGTALAERAQGEALPSTMRDMLEDVTKPEVHEHRMIYFVRHAHCNNRSYYP